MKEIENDENLSNCTNSSGGGFKAEVCRMIKSKETDKLLELARNCVITSLKDKAVDKNIFSVFYLVFLLRRTSSSLEIVEFLDLVLKKTFKALEREIDRIDKFVVGETLKVMNQHLEQENTLRLNFDSISSFLLQCMKKSSKIEISSKLLALSAIKKVMEEESERMKIVEYVLNTLYVFSGGRSNLRSRFLFMCYEKEWYELPMGEVFNTLLNQTEEQTQCAEEAILSISANLKTCNNSLLFCFSFIQFFIENQREEKGLGLFLKIYKEIVGFYPNRPQEDTKAKDFIKRQFNLNGLRDVYKYFTRKAFLFCLEILLKKGHPRRTQVAKGLLKMSLKNICSFQRKRLIKMAKSLVKSEIDSIFEVGIHILAIVKQPHLVNVIEPLGVNRKKIAFNYLKTTHSEAVYAIYLELLSSESTRDVEFVVEDIQTFSRVFHSFPSKEVVQFVEIEQLKVEDAFTADLALWYSKFFPSRIDEIQLVSFFFDTNEQFLISKNINFYVKLIATLSHISFNLSYTLKRRLVSILKDLLFYAPYTKAVGNFLNRIGCNKFVISAKTEYLLVVLAACNHSDFKNSFLESSWSPLKDRALVFILPYHPSYALNYKWRLLEILRGGDPLTKLDLLKFLCETFLDAFSHEFGEDVANFYFSFVDENQNLLHEQIHSENTSVSLQTGLLIYTAIKNKCLLPEKSLPVFLSFARCVPSDVFQWESVILNNLKEIVKKRNKGDAPFLLALFKRTHNKPLFVANLPLERDTVDLVLLLFKEILTATRKKHEKLLSERLKVWQMTVEDEEMLKKVNEF